MEEERKEYLRKLQISKIQPNGSYMITDKKGNIVSMGRLSVDEVRYLRWYHRDPDIANKVVVPVNTKKQPSANVPTKKPTKKKYVVTRDQKYNPNAIIGQQIALHSNSIEFMHPTTNEKMIFTSDVDRYPFNI